jgi:hypothetical protein
LTYRDGDDELPQWVVKASSALPPLWMNTCSQNIGYVFGQNIYTPQDILMTAPIKTDRPYGGWLYGGMFLQRRGDTSEAKIPVLESFEVDVGLTGPASLAGVTQVNFHHWFLASDVPRGWHNQLDNEPGLLLKYERLWRLSPNEQTARYVDLIPHLGAEVGNVMIFGDLGATLRVGVNLPEGLWRADHRRASDVGRRNHTQFITVLLLRFRRRGRARGGSESVSRRQHAPQRAECRAYPMGG